MKALFLQGPLGPFFKHLMEAFHQIGIETHKINFNGGDEYFSSAQQSTSYGGTVDHWPDFLRKFIEQYQIDSIFVYGDGRIYHRLAKNTAEELGVRFYAFEEGYLRPNHITLELGGVNGNSLMEISQLQNWQDTEVDDEVVIGNHLWQRVAYASMYYNSAFIRRNRYSHYQHHRSFSPVYEAACWLRASFRYYQYKIMERDVLARLKDRYAGKFFLFPLQVCSDFQIKYHSPYDSIEQSIHHVVESFSQHANPDHILVIKHHPMDRGHNSYKQLIESLVIKYSLNGRLIYCHDQHLPTLLDHTRGVVTINSTTALSAFYHKAPVKVLGTAFYDIPGLCSQKTLDEFWREPGLVDKETFLRFRNFLTKHGQYNGSFYKKIPLTIENLHKGLMTEEA